MKNIRLTDATDRKALGREIATTLQQGGLVCLPCGGHYRLVADLMNEDAVLDLIQSKGRIRKAPSLVFVDCEARLSQVAAAVHPLALKAARALWPRPLTLLVVPHQDLPGIIAKQLAADHGKIGVRVPAEPLVLEVVTALGRPLLVSSANREKKGGDTSPAQVRKNFANRVTLFVDKGDLAAEPPSTVVDVQNDSLVVTRQGSIPAATITELTA